MNPFTKAADPEENKVWLLDNTAYRPVHPYQHAPQPWQAEFVACFFRTGRKDLGEYVSTILDLIRLGGMPSDEIRQRIEERIQPFVDPIAPARTLKIQIPSQPRHPPLVRTLGPSNENGISSQIELTGGSHSANGTVVDVTSEGGTFPSLVGKLRFADVDGWGVISDIDDTIKITQTPDPIGILRTTFTEVPQTTPGLPDFYRSLNEQFSPTWFFLSASPYNLYPFLHKFLAENYPHGTIILRDNSWMYFGGLLQSLTQGVKAYKVDRMQKIHGWLPKRKYICVGDSTQSDPEAYAEIYSKYPGWVRAIFIRKVTDAPFMEEKNKPERFTKAFEKVPPDVWQVFQNPEELADHVARLAREAAET